MIHIKFGDIITYSDDDYLITHRIIEKIGRKVITKGDNNNEKDTEISKNEILGKVVFKSSVLGIFIRKYLKFVFIGFTIFIIVLNIIFVFNKSNEENVKDDKIKTKKS